MRPACSVATVRRAEAGAGVPEPVLMQRAATALAGVCRDLLRERRGRVRGGRVVALVGSGNNGGDALWALAQLAARGVAGTAVGDPDRMHPEGARAARGAGVRLVGWAAPAAARALAQADLALDGIVGIGGSGGLRGPAADAVAALAAAAVPVVAVDVPSGVDSDTGEVAGATVTARVTVCFGVLKPGVLVSPGRQHAGTVVVPDIGLPTSLLDPAAWVLDLADLAVAPPAPQAHKYRRGVVGVVAGSPAYPGAALLAVGGARRSGAGMVVFRAVGGTGPAPDPVTALVVASGPDVVAAERAVDAACVGPGLGIGPAAVDAVLTAMADPAPLVLDASALVVLGRWEGRAALARRRAEGRITVLTPHAGEFVRLGLGPTSDPVSAASRAAAATGAVVVLKGPGTVVADPEGGPVHVDTFGGPELATAGTGDVLAGLLAGMLAAPGAAGDPPAAARVAARAVGLHGLAGRLAASVGGPVTASDVLAALPAAHAQARAAADAVTGDA